ncbi:MAG TPA: hypothetical protein VII56_09790 [Rhizomicrobium sp.]
MITITPICRGTAVPNSAPPPSTVDPVALDSHWHAQFVQDEVNRLRARKQKLEAERDRLLALRSNQDAYLREMGEMREKLVYDGVGDILSLVVSPAILGKLKGLSPRDAKEFAAGVNSLHVLLDVVAAAAAGADRDRAREKAQSAITGTLELIGELEIPAETRDVLSKAIKLVASGMDDVSTKSGDGVSHQFAQQADSLAQMLGAAVKPIGIARDSIDLFGSAYILWRMRGDTEAIVDSLVSAQRAVLANDKRLGDTENALAFYETELLKARQQR